MTFSLQRVASYLTQKFTILGLLALLMAGLPTALYFA